MWMILARPPTPDARVWEGRRAFALVDAVGWPVAWAVFVFGPPFFNGLIGCCVLAVCMVSGLARAWRAVADNHHYHFTTWRWGRWIAILVAVGYALKLAVMLSA